MVIMKMFPVFVPLLQLAKLQSWICAIRPVGIWFAHDEDDFYFTERFTALKAELEEQLKEEARLKRNHS
jgi:type I restriction enzyme M protein